MRSVKSMRKFLKTDIWLSPRDGKYQSDQDKKLPVPPAEKEYPEGVLVIDLMAPGDIKLGRRPLIEVINQRRSRRKFTKEALTLKELSFLLWVTQGVQQRRKVYAGARGTLRTVPSRGARHPFETYLAVSNVKGLDEGLYRYLPLDHKLVFVRSEKYLTNKVAAACYRQNWLGKAAVIFIWTAIPYRMEWRYTYVAAKTIAQESGHICQNLYLASESIGAGTCAVGAYYQKEMDAIVGVDGEDELVVYVAPVGKV